MGRLGLFVFVDSWVIDWGGGGDCYFVVYLGFGGRVGEELGM